MRVPRVRLVLSLLLLLLGATLAFGITLEDDFDFAVVQGHTQSLREKPQANSTRVRQRSSTPRHSLIEPETLPRLSVAVADLVCVLRC
jgi:hypothetical protein